MRYLKHGKVHKENNGNLTLVLTKSWSSILDQYDFDT